ncbi:MAG: PIG-L deacetylase family protein [Dehalogenimonas sp.]|uniref:PIG-L deacetylase family protein n=1 Tax=Candidatus Dehalogenimonas loeffleri TaxID=3127115 RepID=A0ABZ2J5T3_9CHLR|nr:PIG-L deacetylase family protein [Dehalogenimonas sp.]
MTEINGKVMVIFAHPDDAEFTAGGTIARWTNEGRRVSYVVCTDGSKGAEIEQLDKEDLVTMRQSEQRQAAAILGVAEVTFLEYPDGELSSNRGFVANLTRLIRQFRPVTLLTWDPWRPYQLHTDHRTVGFAALDAVMASGNMRYFPEQLRNNLEVHQIKEIFLFGTDQPDTWVDISSTFNRKIEAIRQHASQMTDPDEVIRHVEEWNSHVGYTQGYSYAEPFKILHPECSICR